MFVRVVAYLFERDDDDRNRKAQEEEETSSKLKSPNPTQPNQTRPDPSSAHVNPTNIGLTLICTFNDPFNRNVVDTGRAGSRAAGGILQAHERREEIEETAYKILHNSNYKKKKKRELHKNAKTTRTKAKA